MLSSPGALLELREATSLGRDKKLDFVESKVRARSKIVQKVFFYNCNVLAISNSIMRKNIKIY